tara:strand:- start:211 stop:756 length:546 start_codon:yes stop_codon:yes gene_type:complete
LKKFFDFNGTINGTSFLLRNLFVVVFLIPYFILLVFFGGIVGMELMDSAGIDIQEIQESGTFDQKELEAQMEEGFKDNPEEILNIFKNAFTPFWIISFIISIIPVVWFSLSTYFKRITALFSKNSIYIFFGLIVTDVILDYLIFKNFLSGMTFKISLLLSLIIFMILIIKDSGIEKEEHEG